MATDKAAREARGKSKAIGPLKALGPFLALYRLNVVLAVFALISTAGLSLILPLAVRRVLDGFAEKSDLLLNQYFAAAVGIAAALAIATALRFWLVTWLGERVVADIRKAVYDLLH